MFDHLLTVNEVANRLSLSPLTVRVWIKRGALPHVRIGPRGIRIPAQALNALQRNQREIQASREVAQ